MQTDKEMMSTNEHHPTIASRTAREFWLSGIAVTQRGHIILKIKIDSFVSKDIFYMYYCKYYSPIMLVPFYSNEKLLNRVPYSDIAALGYSSLLPKFYIWDSPAVLCSSSTR
jgi:hypothetical protein